MLFSFRAPRCSTCSQGSTHGLTATTGAHSSPGSGERLRSPAERGAGARGSASPPGTATGTAPAGIAGQS
ncbi:hypothetical protein HVIM_03999 [Roseomonas mucosa]|nr:hypothetical protein HVIM_03999 [Roseomonas mucosa]QDD98560.1 hypothetical protein ADP8_03999 [Roseomonas mucosa]UZO90753.1 Hypothetical protein RMP42_03999 [Roseomonas mucosa]